MKRMQFLKIGSAAFMMLNALALEAVLIKKPAVTLTAANTPYADQFETPGFTTTAHYYNITVPAGRWASVRITKATGVLFHAYGASVKIYRDGKLVQQAATDEPVTLVFGSAGTIGISAYCKAKDGEIKLVDSALRHADGTPYKHLTAFSYTDSYYSVPVTLELAYGTYHTVKFHANDGGKTPDWEAKFLLGQKYESLPQQTRTNYAFAGWYTSASGGTRITADTLVRSNVSDLYAHWTYSPTVWSITYKPGSYASGTTRTAYKTNGIPVKLLAGLYSRKGYVQLGWSKKPAGNVEDYGLRAIYSGNESITLYPYWGSVGDDVTITPLNTTFPCQESSGELVVNTTGSWSASRDDSATWLTLKTKSGSGKGKIYYALSQNRSSSPRSAHVDVVGQSAAARALISQEALSYDITWDFTGGTCNGYSRTTGSYLGNAVIGRIAPAPTRSGCALHGWRKSYGAVTFRIEDTLDLATVYLNTNGTEQTILAYWRPEEAPGADLYFESKPGRKLNENSVGVIEKDESIVVWGEYDSELSNAFRILTYFSDGQSRDMPVYIAYDGPDEGVSLGVDVYRNSYGKDNFVTSISNGFGTVRAAKLETLVFYLNDASNSDEIDSQRKGSFRIQIGGSRALVNFLRAPEFSYAAVTNGEVRLAWRIQPGAEKYEILRNGSVIATKSVSAYHDALTYTDTSAPPGAVDYQIRPTAGSFRGPTATCSVNTLDYDMIFSSDRGVVIPSPCAYSKGRVYRLPLMGGAGSRFLGWRSSVGGRAGRRYDDGMLVINLAEPGETVTMTALWGSSGSLDSGSDEKTGPTSGRDPAEKTR